ncbi:MAG: hypothetical protein JNJ45_00930 [Chthonomonas sp.]|nr:hypothetical protein [Chthonomonas sp.]
MILATLFAPLPILMLGNSHTMSNDLPGMLRRLLESDGSKRTVLVESRGLEYLESFGSHTGIQGLVKSRKWRAIVLQGLKLSSSHKYRYDHAGAVTIGKLAKVNAEQVVFFAEWPRRGWDESQWILSEYRATSDATDIPVSRLNQAWKPVLAEFKDLALWAEDGNHASEAGSFLAAAGLYFEIAGPKRTPTWRPKSLTEKIAKRLVEQARRAVVQPL